MKPLSNIAFGLFWTIVGTSMNNVFLAVAFVILGAAYIASGIVKNETNNLPPAT